MGSIAEVESETYALVYRSNHEVYYEESENGESNG